MIYKMNKERWLYLFILLNPIFDLLSSLFKSYSFLYTPSTFLRPLIPLGILVYIFIVDKNIRKKLLLLMSIYVCYAIIHLYLYSGLIRGISYGGIKNELQYLINYTYLVFTLITFIYTFYKKKHQLINFLFYNITFYITLIYIAILTNTSLPSYIEGVGYKGWFYTSGAVGLILIVSLFILLPYLMKKRINLGYKFLFIFGIFYYLMFLLGSRVGLYGGISVIICLLISIIFYFLINARISDIKKNLSWVLVASILLVTFFFLFGSYSIERRKQLKKMADEHIHLAYDVLSIKKHNDNNYLPPNHMSKEQVKALNSLAKYATKHQFSNVDIRKQQLVYHLYLYKYQHSILLKLFGNGYLVNFGALTLEMEQFAYLFNFGIIGLLLYYFPFLAIFTYGTYIAIKYIKKIDVEYMMYLFGILISYLISFFAGHAYFNTSAMPVIIIIHLLLLNKSASIKENCK